MLRKGFPKGEGLSGGSGKRWPAKGWQRKGSQVRKAPTQSPGEGREEKVAQPDGNAAPAAKRGGSSDPYSWKVDQRSGWNLTAGVEDRLGCSEESFTEEGRPAAHIETLQA